MNATITHTLEDGKTLRMCLMCQMQVTEDGKPDPQFYPLKWIEKFNARTGTKCDHKKPGLSCPTCGRKIIVDNLSISR